LQRAIQLSKNDPEILLRAKNESHALLLSYACWWS